MSDSVVAESAGKIFGKLRSKAEDSEFAKAQAKPTQTSAPTTSVDRINPKAKFGDNPGEKRIDVKDMVKPLTSQEKVPSYEHGTDYVPKTGPAHLHKGEAVIPAKDNPASSVMDKITGGVPAKVIDHMVHRKKDGKHVISHHHTRPEHHPVEHHHLADMDAVHDHMEEHAGEPNPGEADADAGQSGIPAPPALPAGAPAGAAPAVGA